MKKYKILIIQRVLSQYRKPFYELLRKRLSEFNVELVLIYNDPSRDEAMKKDLADIEWAHQVDNYSFGIGKYNLYWQQCLKYIKDTDLVIVEQASKLLLNYLLFGFHLSGTIKLCFWGHGKNFQRSRSSLVGETLKKMMSRHVYWWFAYNNLSASVVKSIGFPSDRITSVQNAIDTRYLISMRQSVNKNELSLLKSQLAIKGDNTCLYIGGMYHEKRLDFLLEACVLIRQAVPDFEVIFIGAGPDDYKVKSAEEKFSWIHYVGTKFDYEKIPYFLLSKLLLLPGLVGLAILDSFALGIPLITTNIAEHGPEIDYLVDGVNGVIVGNVDDPSVYADSVSYLLENDNARGKLVAGCDEASQKYTIEEMANRFADGVLKALKIEIR